MDNRNEDVGKKGKSKDLVCFVIMPSGAGNEYRGGIEEAKFIFKRYIRPAVERVADECDKSIRIKLAIQTPTPAIIADEIVKELQSADLVIADLTGRNANVYYELGIRYSLDQLGDRPTIPVAQSEADLAFDIAHIRAVIYGKEPWQWHKQRKRLRKAVREALMKIINGVTSSVSWNPVQRVLNPEQPIWPPYQLMGQGQLFKRTWRFQSPRIAIVASSQETPSESYLVRHYTHSTGSGQFYSLGWLLPPLALAYPTCRIDLYLVGHLAKEQQMDSDFVFLGGATNERTKQLLEHQKEKGFAYYPADPKSEEYSRVEQIDSRGGVVECWRVVPDTGSEGSCTIKEDFGIIVWTHLPNRIDSRVLIAFGGTTYGTEAAIRFVIDPGEARDEICGLRPFESIAYAVRTSVKDHRCGEQIGHAKCLGRFVAADD